MGASHGEVLPLAGEMMMKRNNLEPVHVLQGNLSLWFTLRVLWLLIRVFVGNDIKGLS